MADAVLMGSKDRRFLVGPTALVSLGGPWLPVAVATRAFGWGIAGPCMAWPLSLGIRLASSLWRLRPVGRACVVGVGPRRLMSAAEGVSVGRVSDGPQSLGTFGQRATAKLRHSVLGGHGIHIAAGHGDRPLSER